MPGRSAEPPRARQAPEAGDAARRGAEARPGRSPATQLVDGANLAREALTGGDVLREQAVFVIGATNALFLSGQYDDAEETLGTLLARAQRTGNARDVIAVSGMRSWCRYLRGALPGAEADARTSLQLGAEANLPVLDPLAAAMLGAVSVERGDPDEARRAVAPLELVQEDDDFGFLQLLHVSEAGIRIAAGDARGALAALAPCRRFEDGWGPNPGIACVVPWRSTAALAHLVLGERDEALALAEEDLRLARAFGAARPIGVALCALGRAEGGQRGIELLEQAVGVLERADARVEHARGLIQLGSALRRTGRAKDAQRPLRDGMDLAHRCGAAALVETAHGELRLAGARPRRVRQTGVDALTPGERRVAELAADGLTNKEIAQTLFVTLRTVEMHLSNAYGKLEISSRQELPRALDR